jgi:hypothetical protein
LFDDIQKSVDADDESLVGNLDVPGVFWVETRDALLVVELPTSKLVMQFAELLRGATSEPNVLGIARVVLRVLLVEIFHHRL